jgi:hypothetical protein
MYRKFMSVAILSVVGVLIQSSTSEAGCHHRKAKLARASVRATSCDHQCTATSAMYPTNAGVYSNNTNARFSTEPYQTYGLNGNAGFNSAGLLSYPTSLASPVPNYGASSQSNLGLQVGR